MALKPQDRKQFMEGHIKSLYEQLEKRDKEIERLRKENEDLHNQLIRYDEDYSILKSKIQNKE